MRKLMSLFINEEKEKINTIHYFSAYPLWIRDKTHRHKIYTDALRSTDINIVLGQFKEKERKCLADCRKHFKSHEEKETDINIAIKVLADAFRDEFDTACIVSGDSDLSPALQTVKKLFPTKRIGVVLPPYQFGAEITQHADFTKKIYKKHLRKSLFPREISYAGRTIKAPDNWLP